ncbi:MAG: type II secretion system protein [Planctomycetota bacterium]
MLSPSRRRGGFSLTELLVVIAIVLILIGILSVGLDVAYTRAISLRCQNRLAHLGQACRLFLQDQDGRWPRSWNNRIELAGGGLARRRWYEALAPYCERNEAAFRCPVAASGSEHDVADVFEGTGRILYYNLGIGRKSGGWGSWSTYARSRAWLTDPNRTPQDPDNVPFEVDYAGGDSPADWLTADLLDSYDQVWILGTITYGNGFHDEELDALNAFHQAGGGIHFFIESHGGTTNTQWVDCANALSQALGYGIGASYGQLGRSEMNFEESAHPVMAGVRRHATNPTPAHLELGNGAQAVGIDPSFGALVAVWDGGAGRVVVHASFTTVGDNSDHWMNSGDDIKGYCNNVAQWLFGGSTATGECSYGYNDGLGRDPRKPGADTICIMDYAHWRIRRGLDANNDPGDYLATRHGGRANALLGDGRVVSLHLEDITPGMWTPEPGD